MPTTSLKRRGAPSSFSSSIKDNAKVDIQPLRDLAKNFDIDIEPYLQEYLRVTGDDDMEVERYGDDGSSSGTTTTTSTTTTIKQHNFAAAALKIQNSVGIYNRKVDFLHKVVYQVFHEFIQSTINANTNKKNRPSSANNNKGGGRSDSAIDAFREYDSEIDFLLLDGVLPVDRSEGHGKINLKEEFGMLNNGDIIDDVNATGVNLDQTLATSAGANININGGIGHKNNDNTPTNVTLLSLGGVMSATRIMDQDGTFVVSRQSLDRANQSAMSRMLLANLQGGGGGGGGGEFGGNNEGEGNLRLVAGMCDMGSNGALLMPGTRASVFVNGEAAAVPNGGDQEDMQIFPGGLSPGPHENHNNDAGDFGAMDDASFGNNGGGNDWGDDDHGVGFQLNDEPVGDTVNNLDGGEKKNEEGLEAADAFVNNDNDKQTPTKPKAMEDPWAVLDPHEPSRDRPQPLRIGVTYRLPPELDEDDRPSAAVTGSRTRIKKKKGSRKKKQNGMGQSSTAANDFLAPPFLADVTFHEAMREEDEIGDGDTLDQSEVSIQPNQNGGRHLKFLQQLRQQKLIFGEEFAYVAKAHGKHREALRKQRRLEQQEILEAKKKAEERNIFDDDDHEDYGGGGIDFGGGDDDDSFGGQDFGNINDDGNESIHRSNVDFNAIDDVFGTGGGVAFDENDYNDDFANGAQHQTFEELCRAHLRKFAKSAEVYAAETQLTKRVGAWQEGLAPLLEEQEQRPEFDIHGCGRQVLQRVERNITVRKRTSTGEKKLESYSDQKQKNNAVAFSTIFSKDCEDYEVCRLFLSTLMLCNSGNVTMHKNNPNGKGIESIESLDIELLDATFQAPMESFVAPSVEGEEFLEKENRASSSDLYMVDEDIEV